MKVLLISITAIMLFSCSSMVFAQSGQGAKSLGNKSSRLDRPVAIIVPAEGHLADDSGKLYKSIALECISGKPDGISYGSPDNHLNVAVNSPVNIDVSVDKHAPVRFSAIRKENKSFPDGMMGRADDTQNTLVLIRNLESVKNIIQVHVTNPVNGKTEAFTLKPKGMKGMIKEFHSFCEFR